MSDRKRDKVSKSSYMRNARKQRMIENQFLQEVEKAQESDERQRQSERRKRRITGRCFHMRRSLDLTTARRIRGTQKRNFLNTRRIGKRNTDESCLLRTASAPIFACRRALGR